LSITAVEEVGLINEHDLGIWNDAQVQSFKPLIAFMKGENTAIGIQLAHGGRKASSQRAMDGMGPLTRNRSRRAPSSGNRSAPPASLSRRDG
jgi:2,4-dienoyl-CoA reductase-like NADH-dependent reductase (Old Yellow Enzyme family)